MNDEENEPKEVETVPAPKLFIGTSLVDKHPDLKAIRVDGVIYIMDVTEGCIELPVVETPPEYAERNKRILEENPPNK